MTDICQADKRTLVWMRSLRSGWYLIYRRINAPLNPWKLPSITVIFTCKTKILQLNSAPSSKVICKQCLVASTHVYFLFKNRKRLSSIGRFIMPVTRMGTTRQDWTPYGVYTM